MDRGLDRQQKELNRHKELLGPWLPFHHFSEKAARELQGTTPEEVRLHFLQHFCGCDPKSLEAAAKFFGLNPRSTPDCAVLASLLAEVSRNTSRERPLRTVMGTRWTQ